VTPVVIALFMLIWGLDPLNAPWAFYGVQAFLVLAFSIGCIVQGDRAEARWGKDPGNAVADETAGQALTLLFLPYGLILHPPIWAMDRIPELTGFTLVFAFLAFRAMDIVKPWPARQIQRVSAGWGILLDDLVAGAYAAGVVQLCARLVLR